MSERDSYPPGVPSWVDTLQPEPAEAISFYGRLFGWESIGPGEMPGDPPGEYFVACLRGRDVAGVGSQPADAPAAWNTHVSVQSVDAAADAAVRAGGQVLLAPFDAPPAARMAVLSDPSGAVLCVWESRERKGAQLINEPGAWAMSVLHTRDPDACGSFYHGLFGWEVEPFEMGMNLFRLPGYVGGEPQQPVPRDLVGVMAPIADDTAESHWSVDFWVHDADAAAETAVGAGGSVLAGPFDAGGLHQVVLADPSGAAFSVTTARGPR